MDAAKLMEIVNACRAEQWKNSDLMRETERRLEIIADHFSGCEECRKDFNSMEYESETLLSFLGESAFETTDLLDWIHEVPPFDFSVRWELLSGAEQDAWTKKCEEITEKALEKIAKKHNVPFSEIKDSVYQDAEEEWAAADKEVSDEDWIDATVQNFETELAEQLSKYYAVNIETEYIELIGGEAEANEFRERCSSIMDSFFICRVSLEDAKKLGTHPTKEELDKVDFILV